MTANFEPVATRRTVEWHCDVEAYGADRGVVAETDTHPDPQRSAERRVVGAHLPGIDKGCHAEVPKQPLAKLDRSGVDRRAADRAIVGKQGSDRLIFKTSHRRAATAVKTLIRRQLELSRPLDAANQSAQGQDAAALGAEPVMAEVDRGRAGGLQDCEGTGFAAQRLRWRHGEADTAAVRRVG